MKPNATCPRRRHSQRGFTLIEVLISILIFSLGILGTIAMQTRAVQFAEQNGDRSRAALLANDMVSHLWAMQSVTPDPTYYGNWQAAVSTATASGLPNGAGSVSATAGVATVKITWKAPSISSAASANYTTSVVIQ